MCIRDRVRLAGRQQSKMPYIAAVPLAVYTVTHFIPPLTSVAAVSFVVFSVCLLYTSHNLLPKNFYKKSEKTV